MERGHHPSPARSPEDRQLSGTRSTGDWRRHALSPQPDTRSSSAARDAGTRNVRPAMFLFERRRLRLTRFGHGAAAHFPTRVSRAVDLRPFRLCVICDQPRCRSFANAQSVRSGKKVVSAHSTEGTVPGATTCGHGPAPWQNSLDSRGALEHELPSPTKLEKRKQTHHPALPYTRMGAFMADLSLQRDFRRSREPSGRKLPYS
jgi:hypothetical protein